MELRHLRYFVAVAEESSFRRAADRLHVSQPALGRQVRDLEDEIGTPLFERTRRGVALTDAGTVFLESARHLLRDAEDALKVVSEAARGEHGRLAIGNIGALSASFLPGVLATFREQAARIEIDVIELSPDEQLAGLLDDTLQVCFQTNETSRPLDHARFSSMPVQSMRYLVAMPRRHHLAASRTVPLELLAKETLLNYRNRERAGYEGWLRAFCEEEGGFVPRVRRPALDNAAGLFAMIAAEQGIAVLPEVIVRDTIGSKSWTTRPLRGLSSRLELAAIWRRDDPSLVLKKFLALLGKQVPFASTRTVR